MECMQLQEDKFRPGLMQLKDKMSAVLGGLRVIFFHPLLEFPSRIMSELFLPMRLHLHTHAQ
jgi:hypothetical protein